MTSSNSTVRISHFCHHTFVCRLVTCLHASKPSQGTYQCHPTKLSPNTLAVGQCKLVANNSQPQCPCNMGCGANTRSKKPIDNKLHLHCSQFCTTLLSTPTGVLIKIIILKSAWEQNFRFEKLPKIGTTQTIHFSKKRIIQ